MKITHEKGLARRFPNLCSRRRVEADGSRAVSVPPPHVVGYSGSAFLALLIALFLCGCSSFNRDWRKAAAQPTPANSIEGRWEGSWTSGSNAHTGNLRCLLTHKEGASYQARFRATYGKIFHFSYTTPLTVQEHSDGWEFNGESNLGKMAGGIYYYEGRATTTNFFSTYKSKYDHGVFEMQRPE